jgi:hypothetical protein
MNGQRLRLRAERPTPTLRELAEPDATVALEHAILAALEAPLSNHETMFAGFHRKELAVAALFAQLSVADARALHRRLTMPSSSDPLAVAFNRLVSERRARLVAFLADARRRQAIARARL